MGTKPVVPDPVPEVPDRWLYSGPSGLIFSHVPVTPEPGDVIRWPVNPTPEWMWAPTELPVSRDPDNWRPEPEPSLSDTEPVPAGSDS